MPHLLTQDFIRRHGLPSLAEQFHIKVRRHGEFPNLVHLKYDQINSPMGEPVVQECRGLILDEADDWRVVSYPFRKFFNHGEGHAAQIDWATAEVQEKLDGSLMVLYWYAGEWRVASSGTPDASGPVWGHMGTFADLFWEAWRAMGWCLPMTPAGPLHRRCFMFEMMTPFNRVVVPHDRHKLVLIGCRDLFEGFAESDPKRWAIAFAWESVRSYPLQTIDDVLKAAAALSPAEGEGYVVVDAAFNRVKVKSPAYVALAHAKDGCGPSKLLDLIRANESAEFLSYFPEFKAAHEHVAGLYAALCDDLERDYAAIRDIQPQKDFAIAAQRSRCSSPLFAMRAGKCSSVREFFAKANVGALEKALKYDPAVVVRLMGRCATDPEAAEAPAAIA